MAARRARTAEVLQRLRKAYPDSGISLEFENEFQLLVAVILSAQCTDVMVNKVTRLLFPKYPDVDAFARARRVDLERAIRPTGYFRQKAKHIVATARIVRDEHHGVVPKTMEELVRLPGVGRKTANVVLWNAFGSPVGIAVDTHVTRLARLLRLTNARNPTTIERDLMGLVPRGLWGDVTHYLIDHGRAVCIARRPRCEACVVNDLCPSALRPASARLKGQVVPVA